jgi:hypothetical protein
MVSFMKLDPQDHRAQKKFIKWGRIEGLKNMNRAGARACPKPCIKMLSLNKCIYSSPHSNILSVPCDRSFRNQGCVSLRTGT